MLRRSNLQKLVFFNYKQLKIRCNRNQHNYSTLFISPDPNFVPTLTTPQIIEKFSKHIGASIEYGNNSSLANALESRRELMSLLPSSRNELPERKMSDSFVSAVIPLSSDPILRDRYVTYFGTVRVGRLLEDLDVFAVWSCYKHILNPKALNAPVNPYSVVTALVDTIHFSGDTMSTQSDIRLSGHVSWVGTSSMEVSVLVDQKDDKGNWKELTTAVFVLVARDPLNQGSAMINPLIADTPEEKKYIEYGEIRNKKRKLSSQESLITKPPTEEEHEIIHQIFLSSINPVYGGFRPTGFGDDTQLSETARQTMKNSRLNTLLLCHPQYRNRFNKIFGGFIMRQAFELAFSNVYVYSKTRPKIINIDDIVFRKPVEIGALLRFGAEIGYVEDNYIHSPVIAEVMNPETRECDVTNIFQFTFKVDTKPPALLPNTYQEAMMYLNSRRHFKEMMRQCQNAVR